MADTRNGLTKASGITADLVLELGTYYSAQDMRKVQTGLTTAAREIRALTQHGSLVGRLGEKLSQEQRELLIDAAALLDSVKYNVEHAKERKARIEKELAKKRLLWDREAEHLAKTHFPLPAVTVSDQVRILELYLVARVVLGHNIYMKDFAQLRRMMQEDPPRWSQHTLATWRRSEVATLLADIHSAIRDYLSWDIKITPSQRLEELNRSLDSHRAEVLSQPQNVEIIRIWSEALKSAAFIASVMPGDNPSR